MLSGSLYKDDIYCISCTLVLHCLIKLIYKCYNKPRITCLSLITKSSGEKYMFLYKYDIKPHFTRNSLNILIDTVTVILSSRWKVIYKCHTV